MKRAGCFALLVFLVYRDCCVALPLDIDYFFYVHTGIATETYVTENYFEVYTCLVEFQLILPHLNISNCQSVLKYLSL